MASMRKRTTLEGATGDTFCMRRTEDGIYPGTLIVRCFKKCSSSALDGTEYSALFEDDSNKEDSDEVSSNDVD